MPLAVAYREIREEEKPIQTIETMRSDTIEENGFVEKGAYIVEGGVS